MNGTELSLYEIKRIELELLQKFDNYCQDNNLVYFLSYGTLLGAIRHCGFIPWDDDIDVMMPRKDYEYLIHNYSMPGSEILSVNTDCKYFYPFAKIHCPDTLLFENNSINTDMGVYIDIFPLDKLPEEYSTRIKFQKSINLLKHILMKKYSKLKGRKGLSYITTLIVKVFLCFVNIQTIGKLIDKKSQKYNSTDSRHIGCIAWGEPDEYFDEDIFFPPIKKVFEGKELLVPNKYDYYLKHIYGDYLQLPPIEKQVATHSFKAFMLQCFKGEEINKT